MSIHGLPRPYIYIYIISTVYSTVISTCRHVVLPGNYGYSIYMQAGTTVGYTCTQAHTRYKIQDTRDDANARLTYGYATQ